MRPQLHREAMRYLSDSDEAEDIAQEVVLKLWTMHERLEEYRSVGALATVMVRRLCLNRRRGAAVSLDSGQAGETCSADNPEQRMISREDEERVWRLMDSLPGTQQAVLRMRHVDGMEVAEIARLTGSTPEAVRQNLSRARRTILKRFVE